ncbi:MAG: YdcF family protein [Spirochaetota bacterium]
MDKGFVRKLLGLATFLLVFFSSFPVSQLLIRYLESPYTPISIANAPQTDAIVVLGGMINPLSLHDNRTELLGSGERLTDAILLYRAKKAERIVFSGGSGLLFAPKSIEATNAGRFLESFGIAKKSIILEGKSKNTQENARNTAELFRFSPSKKILLVTSAFHMNRSEKLFRKEGFDVIPFPTDYHSVKWKRHWNMLIPSTHSLAISTIAIKEIVGTLVYGWKGYFKKE